MIYRHEAEEMSKAHAEGYHTPPDGLPREGCPDCEGRELRSYPTDRDAQARAAHALGDTVATILQSIGGRSETVSGEVVDHRRGQLVVQTEAHGRIMVALDKVI